MSKEIDERVVSMEFDNAQFEKNIQKSLKSIDDLNKSLNDLDGAKGFNELSKAAKNVDLTPIIDSAKNAEKSFSALEIAGITTISRLTNTIIDFGAKMGKNFWNATIGQIKSGGWKRASDIKAGEFMLEGLGFTGERLKAISTAAKEAVSGTAAGLGEAMKAAGTLAASGLTDAEKMESTLKGIAGVSAMTGRSFENIADIYSTVASNGKLMTMQLRQFSFAGINAAATLAKELGTSEAAINEMVKRGEIDFETFADAMTNAFGDHAKEANRTFTGALANMKAALSRIGERFATPLMDNMKEVFNALRQTFNAVNKAMEPIYEDFEKLFYIGQKFLVSIFSNLYTEDEEGNVIAYSKALDNLVQTVRNLYSIFILVGGVIADAFAEVFPPIEDTTYAIRDLTGALVPTREGLKAIKVVFKAIFSVVKVFTDAITVAAKVAMTAMTVVFRLINLFVGLFGWIDDATGGLFSLIQNINIFEIALDGICLALMAIAGAIAGIMVLVARLFMTIKDVISFSLDGIASIGTNIINGIINGLKTGFDALKKIWSAIVGYIPEEAESELDIHSPSKLMFGIGVNIILGLIKGIAFAAAGIPSIIKGFLKAIISPFGILFDAITLTVIIYGKDLSKTIKKVMDVIKNFVSDIFHINDKKIEPDTKGLDNFVNKLKAAEKEEKELEKATESEKKTSPLDPNSPLRASNKVKQKLMDAEWKHSPIDKDGPAWNNMSMYQKMQYYGRCILEGLRKGLLVAFEALQKAWDSVVEFIPESICKILGINSPSTVMIAIGGFIVGGLILGLLGGFEKIVEIVGKIKNEILGIDDKKVELSPIDPDSPMLKNNKITNKLKLFGSEVINNNEKIKESNNQAKNNIVSFFGTFDEKMDKSIKTIDKYSLAIMALAMTFVLAFSHTSLSNNAVGRLIEVVAVISLLAFTIKKIKSMDLDADKLAYNLNVIKEALNNFKLDFFNKIKKRIQDLREYLEEVHLATFATKVLIFSIGVQLMGLMWKVGELSLALARGITAVSNLSKIRFGFLETTSDRVLKFALAISSITASLAILSEVPEDGLKRATLVMGGILGLILGMGIAFEILARNKATALVVTSTMQMMKNMAISFAVLAGVITAISFLLLKIPNPWTIVAALTGIAVLITAFVAIMAVLMVNANTMTLTLPVIAGLGLAVLSLGITIDILVKTAKKIVEAEHPIKTFLAFSGIFVAAIAALIVIIAFMRSLAMASVLSGQSVFAGGELFATLLSIAAMFLAVSKIIKVVYSVAKDISKAEHPIRELATTIILLVGMTHLMMRLLIATRGLTFVDSYIKNFAIGILALATAAVMISRLKQEDFNKAMARITWIMIIASAITLATNIVAKLFGLALLNVTSIITNIGGIFAGIGIAMGIMAAAMTMLPADRIWAFIAWTSIITFLVGVIVTAFAFIAAIVETESNAQGKKKSRFGGFTSLIFSIVTLMVTLTVLSFIPWQQLLPALLAMGGIIIALGVLVYALSKIKANNLNGSFKTIVTLSLLTLALSGIVVWLTYISQENIMAPLAAAASLALIVIALGELCVALGTITSINLKSIGMLLLLGVAVGIIGLILYKLANIEDPVPLLIATTALSILMLALAGSLRIMNGMIIKPSAMIAIAEAVGMMIAIGLALATLQGVDTATLWNVVGAISAVLIVLGAFIGILGAVSGIPLVSKGLLALGAILSVVAVIIIGACLGVTAALLSFALAFRVVTVSLMELEQLDIQSLANDIHTLASSILDLGVSMGLAAVAIAVGLGAIGIALGATIAKLIPLFIGIGALIMIGLSKGEEKYSKLPGKTLLAAVGGMVTGVEKTLMIASPSKVFAWIGEMIMKGLQSGIVANIPGVGEALESGLKSISEWLMEKSAEFEEVGDSWMNAFSVIFGGSSFIGDNPLGSILDDMKANMSDILPDMDDMKDSFGDIGASAGDASEGVDDFNNSIAQSLDMFSEFNDQAYLSGNNVLNTFMGQLEGVSKWREELDELSSRGLGEVILKELEAMGPSAYEKIHAFYTMTDAQLSLINIMYKKKLMLQNGTSKKISKSFSSLTDDISDTLEDGIDEMSVTMEDSIEDFGDTILKALKKHVDYENIINTVAGFRNGIADKIRNSMSIFEAVGEQEEVKAEELLKNMKDQVQHVGKWASMIVEMASKGFDEGLVAMLTEAGPQSYSKVAAFLTMNEDQIAEANRLYEAAEQVPEYGADKIVKAFAEAGFTASMGLTDSFLEGLDPEAVEQAMGDLAHTSITTLLEELNEPYSPYELGNSWAGEFAHGLEDGADEVSKAADKFNEALDKITIEDHGLRDQLDTDALREEKFKQRKDTYVSKEKRENAMYNDPRYKGPSEEDLKKQELENLKALSKAYTGYNQNSSVYYEWADRLKYRIKDSSTGDEFLDKAIIKALESKRQLDPNTKNLSWYKVKDKYKDSVTYSMSDLVNDNILGVLQNMANTGDEEAGIYYEYFKHLIETGAQAATDVNDNTLEVTKENAMRLAEVYTDKKVLNTMGESGEALGNAGASGLYEGLTGGGYKTSSVSSNKDFSMDYDSLKDTPVVKGLINFGEATGAALEEKGVPSMETAGTNVATAFIMGLRDGLFNLIEGILGSDDEVTTPKIKPVLDGSGVLDSIKSLFNNSNTVDLSANVNMAYKDRDTRVVDAINNISNQAVVDTLKEVINEIDLFRAEAGNLNVVMDTGKLVGQLLRPMDIELGQNATYAGRGV